ncbi:unnamed protein product [Cylindrotheca closterium]|uniref:Leucine-rich repeat-containing N-terminal plant-type domain-containing protein n=1 Tax=Cylindrotheca closterium TaxID=2856 RepID=A0AAD2JHR2_9STRA|nr:unnamed protein product [Cylindrotheca closterium]
MDTPKAANKGVPPDDDGSSPRDPTGDKAASSDAQIAAQKLDDLIEGQRKEFSGRRLERHQSRRITSLSSRRNLMAASPSMVVRKTRSEVLLARGPSNSFVGNAKNPPSTDSSTPSQSEKKEPSGNLGSPRMSKTSENLQLDLEAKTRARGLRSPPSVRNIGASWSPSIRNLGAKKAPPPPPPPPPSDADLNTALARGPRRHMSRGDCKPSPVSRNPDPTPLMQDDPISSFEVQMGGLNSASRTDMASTTIFRGNSDESHKDPSLLLSPSNSSVRKQLPSPSFRRNTFMRDSSMSVLRSATASNARDLDQLIAYKTGIPLESSNNEEAAVEEQKPATEPQGQEVVSEENGVILPSPRVAFAADPSRPATGSLSGMTNNRDLDELIAYKTGIPLQDGSNEEHAELTVEQVAPGLGKGQLMNSGEDYPNQQQMAKRPELGGDAFAAPEGKGEKYDPEGGFGGNDWVDGDDEEDLAVAIEVQEPEEDAFIPAAIEYDPDAKPPIYKHRRFRFYCAFLFGLAAMVAVGVVSIMQSEPEIVPQPELPSEPTEAQSIKSTIELLIGEEKLADVDGPHYAALDWITNVDKLQVGLTDTGHLIQRYIVSLFHFQTWNWLQSSCGATDLLTNQTFGVDEHECLYQQLHSVFPARYRSMPSYRWLTSKHECEWAGIRCDDDGNIRVIDLAGQNIRGNLPPEFKELRFLQSLMLSWNQLTGAIPKEYGGMQYLVNFELGFNELTGTLPMWTETRNLQLFNVGSNSLSGTIPTFIKNMKNLGGLYLFDNAFRGEIPDWIGDVSTLKYIRLSNNFLTGTLPTTIGHLNPTELTLAKLELSGPLPSELGKMTGMKTLKLHSTPFDGIIPEEFYNMTSLQRLDMYDCSLSGTLSTSIGKMANLLALRISNNRLSGPLPAELGNLPQLGEMWVHGNNFDGAVPFEVCSSKELASLEVVSADCLPMSSTGIAQNSCDCCDTCCNAETKMCTPVGE